MHELEKNPTWQLVVAGALRRTNGRWLMHKRPPEKRHGGLWEFPGGKVESKENPQVALARELQEELGISVLVEDLQPVSFANEQAESANQPIVILLYIIGNWQGDPHAREGGEIGWFSRREMAKLPKPPLDSTLLSNLFRTSEL